MDDLARQVAGLRLKLRLQMLVVTGALMVALFAQGGADVVARALIETDAWTIRTKNVAGTLTPRLVATTDVDVARIQVQNANLELAQQVTAPPGTPGKLWYDSTTPTSGKLKLYNGTSWVEAGGGGGLFRAPQVLTSGASYTPPSGVNAIMVVLVGAGGGGGGSAIGYRNPGIPGGGGGAGSVVQKYISSPGVCSYAIGGGGGGGQGVYAAGSSGGATSFTFGTTTVTAPGGSVAGPSGPPGAGGTIGTNGDINGSGAPGLPGFSMVSGTVVTTGVGGGGSTQFGGGGASSSQSGQGFGAGGAGAANSGAPGGSGASGAIIIYEYR